ncbi:hypothetical protein DPMN_154619 [Dreissena polymorpha]|uniref:Uncharacterized protein n=1 Tax=Dreissena polymorpha TaxID=45954 RepID=A0A9D4J754_DREPO|nr:hypothetical protein DPMN_154619 [Dreissena polymorpha]
MTDLFGILELKLITDCAGAAIPIVRCGSTDAPTFLCHLIRKVCSSNGILCQVVIITFTTLLYDMV